MNAQQNAADERFWPCPAGRHWGPRGAAGILPYAVARDGQACVLLSHRSPHVQRGGTWSTFGGPIDVGESAWRAMVRETCEELRGITPDRHCGKCVWSLPRARVARGHAAWETAGLAWVPVSQVRGADRDLHPSFTDAWPTLHEAISGPRFAKSPES